MKKFTLISILSTSLVALFFGCTLSTEEWIVPEEEMGFDEPVTVQNEFGTCTYQYNEGVQPVTRNVQEYLVRVVEDTILYFLDTTPKEWIPVEGELLSSGCTRKLPWGLNHRVLSVQKEAGLYKVVVTEAERKEVFKVLKYTVDLDYTAPERPLYDSLEMVKQGLTAEDIEDIDFTYLDSLYGDEEEQAQPKLIRTRAYKEGLTFEEIRTRAEAEEAEKNEEAGTDKVTDDTKPNKGKDEQDKDTTVKIEIPFNIDIGHIYEMVKGKPSSALNGMQLNGTIEKKTIVHEHMYLEEDQEADYRKQYTEDKTVDEWSFNIMLSKNLIPTFSNTKDLNKAKVNEIMSKNAQALEEFKNIYSSSGYKDLVKNSKKHTPGTIRIPLPLPFPVAFIITFNAEIDINIQGFGKATLKQHHAVTRMGSVYKDGQKIAEISDTIKAAYSQWTDFAFGGRASVEGLLRVGAGVEFGGLVGSTIGIGLKPGAEIVAEYEFGGSGKDEIITEGNCYARAYVDWFVNMEFFIAPAGFKLAGLTFDIIEQTKLKETKWYFNPVLDRRRIAKAWKYTDVKKTGTGGEYTEKDLLFNTSFGWSKLWTFSWNAPDNSVPGVRVYHGKLGGKYKDFPADNTGWKKGEDFDHYFRSFITPPFAYTLGIKDKTTYKASFSLSDLLSKESKYYVVPCIFNMVEGTATENRDISVKYEMTAPKITWRKGNKGWTAKLASDVFDPSDPQQLKDFKEEFGKSDPKAYYYYEYWETFDFKNTSLIKDWGVEVQVQLGEADPSYKAYTIACGDTEKTGIINSGKKTVLISFIAPYYSWQDQIATCPGVVMRVVANNIIGAPTYSEWSNRAWLTYPHSGNTSGSKYGELFYKNL